MNEPVRNNSKQQVNAIFADEAQFTAAVSDLVKAGRKPECYMPYPIHGFDQVLGLKRSFIGRPVLTVILIGFFIAINMAWFTQAQDYPLNVGGKPYFAWQTFVVVTLETGLLLGALVNMALAMHTSKLMPDPVTRLIDDRITDDRFAVVVPVSGDAKSVANRLLAHGAEHAEVVTIAVPTAEVAHA